MQVSPCGGVHGESWRDHRMIQRRDFAGRGCSLLIRPFRVVPKRLDLAGKHRNYLDVELGRRESKLVRQRLDHFIFGAVQSARLRDHPELCAFQNPHAAGAALGGHCERVHRHHPFPSSASFAF